MRWSRNPAFRGSASPTCGRLEGCRRCGRASSGVPRGLHGGLAQARAEHREEPRVRDAETAVGLEERERGALVQKPRLARQRLADLRLLFGLFFVRSKRSVSGISSPGRERLQCLRETLEGSWSALNETP